MADRQFVMNPEVIFNENCCLSILSTVENGSPARAEGLIKQFVREGKHHCSATALWRSTASEHYAGEHDSECRSFSQSNKPVHIVQRHRWSSRLFMLVMRGEHRLTGEGMLIEPVPPIRQFSCRRSASYLFNYAAVKR